MDRRKREKAVFQSTRTGATGEARLPPLRAGSLEIRASAEGYARMSQAMTVEIPDETADQTFKILLEPVSDTVRLRLRLPNGAPAPNARVLLMNSLTPAGEELFSESADREGLVELPRKTSGFLLATHPAAAFFVREWRPAEEDNEMEWAFPAAAGQPLVLRVKDASGTTAAANAHLALWVEGRHLAGRSLAWLTGAPPLADANGIWIGNNLPRETVSVLAWSFKTQDEGTTDVLSAQAAPIAFPWPESVDVRVVE